MLKWSFPSSTLVGSLRTMICSSQKLQDQTLQSKDNTHKLSHAATVQLIIRHRINTHLLNLNTVALKLLIPGRVPENVIHSVNQLNL